MKASWLETGKEITSAELHAQGILNMHLPSDPAAYKAPLEKVMKENGYVDQDQVDMSPSMGAKFDEMCHKFSIEHLHPGDEVRFLIAGSGVWEIRSLDDKWMKVEVEARDFITVPADRFHRFYLTDEKHIQCIRLFKDHNGWIQKYRKDLEAEEAGKGK